MPGSFLIVYEDEEGGNTESLIAQLEAQQADKEEVAGISTTGGGDLGTRGERASAKERAAAAEVAGRAEKRGRFDAALEKSNWASQALKPAVQAAAGDKKEVVMTQHSSGEALLVRGSGQEVEDAGEDAADLELQLSLERARRAAAAAAAAVANVIKQVKHEDGGAADSAAALLALQGMGPGSSLAGIAASSARKREEEEARIKEELNPGSWGAVGGGAGSGRIKQEGSTGGGLLFNDSMDFVSNISLKKEDPGVDGMNTAADLHSTAGGSGGDGMDVDSVNKGAKKSGGKKLRNNKGSGGAGRWITASDEEEDEEEEEEEKEERRKQAEADAAVAAESVATQSHLGKGLSGVLSQLKDKGQLQERQVWAGRTSDKSKVALQGLDDVFTGGSHEDRIARSVEAALTRKDEFGRVKTPKERFRELCYDFHGMTPSKNQIAKRQKQAKMELSIMKDASSEREAEDASKLLKVQERASQPFLVLSGKGVKETLEAARGAKGAMLPPPNKLNNASTASKKQKSGGSSGRPPASLGGILGGGLTPLTGDKKVEAMLGVSSTRPLGV
ncbi:hypothetical protein CEUSTIGMA_g10718.t1 [Chlamydomonas eustigma]|uniref:SART-1 family protein n=1 Tax=Chlamydomonas eustigma TaxID=1157962 RepID=A0A250XK48_9CHLO|nr:hypothetical protein CEUSTIGMA_g10718.t1 [Chlamydomonas eustigma]|eukprot:GAX83292.1 hypothetical protein CEUSTIGMA_g10718.t1 [Chlamydomonas eustigma]